MTPKFASLLDVVKGIMHIGILSVGEVGILNILPAYKGSFFNLCSAGQQEGKVHKGYMAKCLRSVEDFGNHLCFYSKSYHSPINDSMAF